MYSTLLQLRNHVETEKLNETIIKQLVRLLQEDVALLKMLKVTKTNRA